MTPEQAIERINSQQGFIPFSNGTEAIGWQDCNCGDCVKSYLTRNPDSEFAFPENEKAVLSGLECFGKYAIDCGWITGVIHPDISEWMGGTDKRLPETCIHFSDDDRDNPEMKEPSVDPRQTKIPFLCVELFGFDNPDILVFDKAIIEREIFEKA